jgi:hypothetical protein
LASLGERSKWKELKERRNLEYPENKKKLPVTRPELGVKRQKRHPGKDD